MVKEDTYVHIESFMVNELHLSGNELITYALIYGFSQDGQSWYSGSSTYIANWCQCSKRTVLNVLKNLTEKGFLDKKEYVQNGIRLCLYRAVREHKTHSTYGAETSQVVKIFHRGGENISPGGGENFSPNTIDIYNSNNKDNVENISKEVIDYLNEKTGCNYKHTTPKTKECIHARQREGFALEDFKMVIDNMCNAWLDDSKMKVYLRPQTLFGTKFESYLNRNTEGQSNGFADKYDF